MVYDFRRSELKFIKKGENPLLHPEKMITVSNMLIIPINQESLSEIAAQKKIKKEIKKLKIE